MILKTPLVIALAAVLGIFSSAAVSAGDASNAAIYGAAGGIEGAINGTTGAVTTGNATINASLTSMSTAIVGEIKEQDTLLSTLAKTELQHQSDLAVAQEISALKLRAAQLYGDQGIDPTCITTMLGQSVSTGRTAMAATASAAGVSMNQRSVSGPGTLGSTAKMKDLLDITDTQLVQDDLYPPSGTLTPTQKTLVSRVNQEIIDPFPPNKISSRVKETPYGVQYEATRLTYEKTKQAPRNLQNMIESMKTADFPVNDWATGAWADMGNTGNPTGSVQDAASGKMNMSYNAFIELFVKSRIDNQQWYDRFDTENDSWQLQQINKSTAMLLEIQFRQMKLLEGIAEVLAQQRANDIDKEYGGQLSEVLKRAESAQ